VGRELLEEQQVVGRERLSRWAVCVPIARPRARSGAQIAARVALRGTTLRLSHHVRGLRFIGMPPFRGWRGSGLPGLAARGGSFDEGGVVGVRAAADAGVDVRAPAGVGVRAPGGGAVGASVVVGGRAPTVAGGRVVPGIGARGVGARFVAGVGVRVVPGVGVRLVPAAGVRLAPGVGARVVGARVASGVSTRWVGALPVAASCAVRSPVAGRAASFLITAFTSTWTRRTFGPCGPTTVALNDGTSGS
jgi:hypothetical protein